MTKNPWYKRVQRKAAAMQAASMAIAEAIAWFEERGLRDCAELVRDHAMRHGVEKTETRLRGALIRRTNLGS